MELVLGALNPTRFWNVIRSLFSRQPRKTPNSDKRLPWWKVLLRALTIPLLGRQRLKEELPKQAVRRGRKVAIAALATHILPVLGAIVLITLNLLGYYIGDQLPGGNPNQDNIKLSTLTFVAKWHELLMQASLSLIVISFV